MTSFDGREKAAENKYIHDEQVNFKINARTNKLLGLWAAKKMHLDNEKALSYAMELVQMGLDAPGGSAVIHKVLTDLTASGLTIDKEEITDALEECRHIAKEQVVKT
jgi:hypothetical protein